jgi:hypothetical protein
MAAAARIATIVIGPQAGGRGYRVLARSEGPAISGVAEGRLSEMALVLAGWAEEREPPAVALIPLTDATAPALLMRFAFLGSAALGTIAYAHGLILDAAAFAACGGRPETLLPSIPPPDGSRTFADAPLTLSPSALSVAAKDWHGLSLEWRDRLVLVDDRAEEELTLCSILRSIGPAGPGARVRGWATSALLPSSGSFAPARELQLLVVESGRRRAPGLPHLPARATATGFDGERVDLPPAARAWERLKSLGAQDVEVAEAVGALRWSPELLDAAPADAIRPAAGQALRALDGQARIRFILALALPRGDPLDADFAAIARHWFAQLIGRGNLDPQHSAFYIKALADGPTAATDAMAPLGPLLLKPGTGRWLRGQTFNRLLQLGYAEALAERGEEAPAILAGLSSDDLPTLIGHLLQSPDGQVRQPAVISSALRELGNKIRGSGPPATWRDFFPVALRWRLNQPPGPDERLLGSRGVVRAVSILAPAIMTDLARRTLHLRDAASPREKLDMLGGTLEWVRRKGAIV